MRAGPQGIAIGETRIVRGAFPLHRSIVQALDWFKNYPREGALAEDGADYDVHCGAKDEVEREACVYMEKFMLPEFGEVREEGVVEGVTGEDGEERFGPGECASEEVAGLLGGLFAGLVLRGHGDYRRRRAF